MYFAWYIISTHVSSGPASSVGIATEYGLAHPASCTIGSGSFPGVKRPGHGADDPPSPSAEVENE
jgi:hypothetical protein